MPISALAASLKCVRLGFRKRQFPLWGLVAVVLLATEAHSATSYVYSTFAGAEHANVDGAGSNARFDGPRGVAVDRFGNVYVTDQANYTVRKITANGVVTTLAGTPGIAGDANGTGSAARFRTLHGVAVDANDNVYVISGSAVRKITPAGVVTTLAGRDGEHGSVNGPSAVARLYLPEGIAVDAVGNVYVLEPWPGRIRKIAPDGTVSTHAGEIEGGADQDGPVATATFRQPTSLAIDLSGNLYVSSFWKIRRLSTAGEVTTLAGDVPGYRDGTGSEARFSNPQSLSVSSTGDVFVADPYNQVIRKVSPAGVVTTFAGTYHTAGYTDGNSADARFLFPIGIAVNSNGIVYVTDNAADTIRAISPSGVVTTLAGSPGRHRDGASASALFQEPQSFARDAQGNTYVADRANHTIRKISATGIVTTVAGSPGLPGSADGPGPVARFNSPLGIAVGSGGVLLVADYANRTIRKIGVDGIVTTLAGTPGQSGSTDGAGGNATFGGPERIAIDAQGNAFVTDSANYTIRRVTPTGVVSTIAGTPGVFGTADGMGAAAQFIRPRGIAVRPDGSLVVADPGAMTIRTIAPDGLVQTLAGFPHQEVSVDGTGSNARFSYPEGLAADGSGNIYIAEFVSGRVRKVTSSGVVTTVFTAADAGWPSAQWVDVSVDANGRIFVLDRGKGVIRLAVPTGVPVDPGVPDPDPTDPNEPGPGTPNPGTGARLVNIATRAFCGTGDKVTIGGFVISGSSPKRVLVRGVGPTLVARGLAQSEVLLDPMIELHAGGQGVIASNDNWGDGGTSAEILAVATQIGAGALSPTDTQSSALLITLNPGAYSFIARGKNNTTGIVLLEVYDADAATHPSKFVNIATRANATTGNGVTIGGFVISGSSPKQVLLRGIGPTLTTLGIPQADVLVDPVIELHGSVNGVPTKLGENDNWGMNANAALITSVGARIGASPIHNTDTASAALLVTLNPGVYSFIASGKGGASGIVLVEVYDAD